MTQPILPSESSLVDGPITRPLFRLAWPVILAHLIQYLFEIVDIAWVGRLENAEIPLAAISLGAFITWMLSGVIQLVVVGTTTIVAQAIGAANRDRARRVGAESLAFGLPFGIGLAVLGLASMELLLEHLQMPGLVADEARRYLRVIYLGLPFTYWLSCFDSIQRGSGDTILPLKIGAVAFSLNALLDPVLIFGLGSIPQLGVEGAAIASITSKATGVLIYARLARRGRLLVQSEEAGLSFQVSNILACARIGAPISIMGILFMWVHVEMVKVIAPFGAGAITALGVGARIEGLTYVVVDALAIATQTMVGQNIGARKPDRALRSAWLATAWGVGVALLMTLAMLLAPRLLVMALAYNASPDAIELCIAYCRINAICQVFMAVEVVLAGGFSGVGYTLPVMLNSVPITLSRIPIALALVGYTDLGALAVFWTLCATCLVRGVVAFFWFRLGPWRRRYLEPFAPFTESAPGR